MSEWICCQIGAREHYAVPRAVHTSRRLKALITETWIPPGSLYGATRPIRERYHPELKLAPVYNFNVDSIAFELSARLRSLGGWPLTIRRNLFFQRRALKIIGGLTSEIGNNGITPVLFAYSYAALDLLRFAKAKGWRTVLGQIDGGMCDERIIAKEHENRTLSDSRWQPAPPEYWSNWKEECSLADTIIVNSDWSKRLLREAGINTEKLRVIPVAYAPGQEAQKFQRSYPKFFSEARPLRVLFLGAFALRKGAAAVLETMTRFSEEPIEFWIVGPAGIDIPSTLRSSSKVKWIGTVSRESTARFYRDADLFLFPTLSDGFGMTQVEARGWKLPVISTPFCAQIIKHGTNGLVVNEVNGESLETAIRSLLRDPIYLEQLAHGSAEEWDEYSFATVSEKISSLAN